MAIAEAEPQESRIWQSRNRAAVLFFSAWLGVHFVSRTIVADTSSDIVLLLSQLVLATAWLLWKSNSGSSGNLYAVLNALFFSGLIATIGLNENQRFVAYANRQLVVFEFLIAMAFAAAIVQRSIAAVRNAQPDVSFYDAIATELIPSKLLSLARIEIKAFCIALFVWGQPKSVPNKSTYFTNNKSISPMMYAFLSIAIVEAILFHYLAHFLPKIIYIPLIMVGDFFILYAVGLTKSLRLYPTYISNDTLRLRVGIFIDLTFIPSDILSITGVTSSDEFRSEGCVKASLLAYPNVIVNLSRPIQNPLPFKLRDKVSSIALKFDDAASFTNAVQIWIAKAP